MFIFLYFIRKNQIYKRHAKIFNFNKLTNMKKVDFEDISKKTEDEKDEIQKVREKFKNHKAMKKQLVQQTKANYNQVNNLYNQAKAIRIQEWNEIF